MTNSLRDHVRSLLQYSIALQTHPEEQWFWLIQTKTLDEKSLKNLAALLEKEQKKQTEILETQRQNLIKAQKEYLNGLTELKQKGIPKFLKKVEKAHKAKENPEDLLNAL